MLRHGIGAVDLLLFRGDRPEIVRGSARVCLVIMYVCSLLSRALRFPWELGYSGIPWGCPGGSMGSLEDPPRICRGSPRISLGFPGDARGSLGIPKGQRCPRGTIGICKDPRIPQGCPGVPRDPSGSPGILPGFPGELGDPRQCEGPQVDELFLIIS